MWTVTLQPTSCKRLLLARPSAKVLLVLEMPTLLLDAKTFIVIAKSSETETMSSSAIASSSQDSLDAKTNSPEEVRFLASKMNSGGSDTAKMRGGGKATTGLILLHNSCT